MSEFKWRHFEGEIILWAVRWYCRHGISYRDLEQMMGERGAPWITPRFTFGFRSTRRRSKATALAVASPAVDELAGR